MASEEEPFVEINEKEFYNFWGKYGKDNETHLFSLKTLVDIYTTISVPDQVKRKLYAHKNDQIGILFSIITCPSTLEGGLLVQNIQLYCHESNIDELQFSLGKTRYLDLNCYAIFNHVDSQLIPAIEKALATNGIVLNWGTTSVVRISPEKALQYVIKCPDEVYVRPLTREDAWLPYKCWRYRFSQTLEHFEILVSSLLSAGVFLKDTNQLVSWIFVSDLGSMGFFYTLKDYRGKGYGKLALQSLSSMLAGKNLTPVAGVESYNRISWSCFKSLDFESFMDDKNILVYIPQSFPISMAELKAMITDDEEN